MESVSRARRVLGRVFFVVTGLSVVLAASARPSVVSQSSDLGEVDPASRVEITLWMKMHDQGGMDSLVAAQQAGKADYLSAGQFRTRFAPNRSETDQVAKFMAAQGFTVRAVGENNLYVSVSGTAAQVERAFSTQLHHYDFHGRSFRSNTRPVTVPSAIAPLVSGVRGFSDWRAEPQFARRKSSPAFARQTDIERTKPHPALLSSGANGVNFSAQCFYAPTSVSLSGPDGVNASYQGNKYGAPLSNDPPNAFPCGYQPSDVWTAYNLKPLYALGLNGKGTTVAIVDAYGSTTIQKDAKAFSEAMGLPPPDITVIGKPVGHVWQFDNPGGWAFETTIDVEWVHAIAPGAKIVLVIAPTDYNDDLIAGIATAAAQPGVVAISNSWGSSEIAQVGNAIERKPVDDLFKAINATGTAVNFSSGDSGNGAIDLGVASPSWPGTSPYVTSIGGVSVALDSSKHVAWQTSWGTNVTQLTNGGPNAPLQYPQPEGFIYGSGGGASDVYPQPSWQHQLPGDRRVTPDISWIGDPFTGVELVYTVDDAGDLGFDIGGGTSVACPMFSALWAVSTQLAHRPLGQAAPHLYRMPRGAITDVSAVSSSHNVTGTISSDAGTEAINAGELAAPLQSLPSYYSTLFQSPVTGDWFVLSFGLDTTLAVAPGYDLATGLGTPNGWAFALSAAF